MLFSKKTLNKVRIFTMKTITVIAGLIFFLCMCTDLDYADMKTICLVFLTMILSGGWLFLVAYVNGWIYETEPWYERESHDMH